MMLLFQQIYYMSYFRSILLTLVLIITIVIFQRIKKQYSLAAQIPGPNGNFIVGSPTIVTQGAEKLLENIKLLCPKYDYSIFKIWFFHKLIVWVSNPGDIEEVMNSPNCFKKTIFHSTIQDTFSVEGLVLTNNTQNYKKNRKIVSEWLKYTNLKSLTPVFYEESKLLDRILAKRRESKSFECDISRAFELASMDTIGRTAMGEKFNSQQTENHVFLNNYEHLLEMFAYKFERPWFFISRLFSLSSKKEQQRNSQHSIHKFVNDLIQNKQVELNEIDKTTITGSGDADFSCYQKPKTLIEILLANHHRMSSKEIRDELMTIMIAGHDLTALTNTLVIFILAHHEDVQNKVFNEINSIFSSGDSNRPPTYEDIQKMDYLERVIKETMRLYPSAPIVARTVENGMTIGKYQIPADTIIAIPIQCLHLNAKYYKDPEQFNPDNFLPEVCRSRHPFAYIPFSGGSRNCVGMKYAMLQMKITVSTLVRSYRFSPSAKCPTQKDLKLSCNIIFKFADGCHVKIESRTLCVI